MNTTKRPITALLFLGFLLAFSPVPVLSQQAPAPEQGSAQSAQGSVSPAEGFSPRSPSAIQTKKTDSQIVDDLDSYRQKLEGILHDRLSFLVAANNYALKVTVEGQPYQKPQDQIFENTLELPGFQMNRDMPGGDSGYTGKYKVTQVGVRILLYKEMTPAEMNYIRSLVTVLADFNPERGDRLDMQVITPEEPAKQKAEMEAQAAAAAVDEQALGGLTWKDWLLWGLLGLLVLMLLIVLFRIMYIQAPKTPKIPKIPDAGDIADSIRGDLEDVVDDRVGELEDKVKSGLGDLEDLMKDGMDDLEDMVKDAMEDAVGDLEGLVKNAVDNAVGDLSNHVNRAVNQMKRPPEQPPYQPPPYQPPPYQPPPPEPPAEPKPSRAEEREDRKSQREEDRESASKRRDREMEDRLIRVRQELVTRLVGRADLARELMKKWQTEDTRKISTLIHAMTPELARKALVPFFNREQYAGLEQTVRKEESPPRIEDRLDVSREANGWMMAQEIIHPEKIKMDPLGFLSDFSRGRVARLIEDEPVKIKAIVLSRISPKDTGKILDMMDRDQALEVAFHIGNFSGIPIEMVEEVARNLSDKSRRIPEGATVEIEGPSTLVDLMGRASADTSKYLLDALKSKDIKLSEAIEKRFFLFDAIPLVPDALLPQAVRMVPSQIVVQALQGADEALQRKVIMAFPERARAGLVNSLRAAEFDEDTIMDARRQVVAQFQALGEQGKINLKEILASWHSEAKAS